MHRSLPRRGSAAALTLAAVLAGAPRIDAQGVFEIESLRVEDGHPVAGFEDGVIFQQVFRPSCNLLTDTSPPKRIPVVGTAGSQVHVAVEVMSCPAVDEVPEVSCRWQIGGASNAGQAAWTGTTGTLTIDLPRLSGVFPLHLTCNLRAAGTVSREIVRGTVYTTLGRPLLEVPPAIDWYLRASSWAAGHTPQAEDRKVLAQMLDALYAFGHQAWRYGSFPTAVPPQDPVQPECLASGWCRCPWQALAAADNACDFGDCYSFSDVYENIAATLGIGGLEYVTLEGANQAGFTTVPGTPSFDSRFPNNVACTDHDGVIDVSPCTPYLFNSHNLRARDRLLFDPTFDNIYVDTSELISDSILRRDQVVTLIDSDDVLCLLGPGYGQWNYFTRFAIEDGSDPGTEPPVCPLLLGTQARLTGQVSFGTEGSLGPGVATQLAVDVEVDVLIRGLFLLSGSLNDRQGNLITHRPEWESEQSTTVRFFGPGGKQMVRLLFSGEGIYRAGNDGPYQLRVLLSSANGVIGTLTRNSPTYQASAFGEVPVALEKVAASGEDADEAGHFQTLRVVATLDVRYPATVFLRGRLAHNGRTAAYFGKRAEVSARHPEVTFTIPASDTADGAFDGAYRLTLSLHDERLSGIGSRAIEIADLTAAAPR